MTSTSSYPTGTVTFLFTDIGGSTRLWESSPDAMRIALEEHNAILHSAVEAHDGVVFKTIGDAVCAAFGVPAAAVLAAIDAQRALNEHVWPEVLGPLEVRMAIHTGAAAETGGDYFGPPLNRVARLMSLAFPGQILVSHASTMLATGALPSGVELRPLGVYRLKDLSEPETTAQVVADGLRPDFPPLPSLDSRPNNLPFEIASFVGRADELAELDEQLRTKRLITVVGTGGIGKTRVALQAAANAIDRYVDGAWFVEAASLSEPQLLLQELAVVLNVREEPQHSLDDTLAGAIGAKAMLVVLDGVDRVVAGAAALVKKLLSRCPSLTVLVTSREPLHLTGERIVRVGPLDKAPELFRERAREIKSESVADDTDANAATIAEICRRLDGIPLAIELAAANVATISVEELLARLGKSLKSLVSRDPTKEQRHRTLRAAIAWSYDLLAEPEATALRALANFGGTFDLAAAAAVMAADEDNTQLLVDELILKSMAWAVGGSQPVRYVLMTTVREYLRDIVGPDLSAEELARRHGMYFASRVTELGHSKNAEVNPNLSLAWVDSEVVNVRQALDWSIEHEVTRAAGMTLALARYWKTRGFLAEGRRYLFRVCALEISDSGLRARLLRQSASFAIEEDDYEQARQLNLESRLLYEGLEDAKGLAETHFNVGLIEQRMGNIDLAVKNYDAAIKGFRSVNNYFGEAVVSHNVTVLFLSRNELDRAKHRIDETSGALQLVSSEELLAHFSALRGTLDLKSGDFVAAEAHYREALAVQTRLGNRQYIAVVAGELSVALAHLHQFEEATNAAMLSLTVGAEIDSTSAIVCGLEALCEISVEKMDYTSAAQAYARAEMLRESQGYNSETMRDRASTAALLRSQLNERFDQIVSAVRLDGAFGVRAMVNEIVRTLPALKI